MLKRRLAGQQHDPGLLPGFSEWNGPFTVISFFCCQTALPAASRTDWVAQLAELAAAWPAEVKGFRSAEAAASWIWQHIQSLGDAAKPAAEPERKLGDRGGKTLVRMVPPAKDFISF